MTIQEMKEFMEGFKDKPDKESENNSNWTFAFLMLLSMVNSPNINLEKEVAFLGGKVDTLEKMLLAKEN